MPSAHRRRWLGLAVIALAQFMVIMDTSIIGVALPGVEPGLRTLRIDAGGLGQRDVQVTIAAAGASATADVAFGGREQNETSQQ